MLEENNYQNHATSGGILGAFSKFSPMVLTIEK
jgi:hypothetical protein